MIGLWAGRSRFAVLAGVLLLMVGGCGLGDIMGETADVQPGVAMSPDERTLALQVFHLVNEERVRRGMAPVLWDETAADVAYDHCVDMRLRGFYDHINPDGMGPCSRLREAGLPSMVCGSENIARGEDTALQVMADWLASPPHWENIFGERTTHLGVGVHAGREGPWWTQEFFTPIPE